MKSPFYAIAALAAITVAAPALAQSSPAESSGASTGAMPAPTSHNNMMSEASVPAGTSNAQYWGVDTAGVREDVKAPYGGRNQTQADRKEAPITERLNEMQLQGGPAH